MRQRRNGAAASSTFTRATPGGATLNDLGAFIAAARDQGCPGDSVVSPVRVSMGGKITKMAVTVTGSAAPVADDIPARTTA